MLVLSGNCYVEERQIVFLTGEKKGSHSFWLKKKDAAETCNNPHCGLGETAFLWPGVVKKYPRRKEATPENGYLRGCQ